MTSKLDAYLTHWALKMFESNDFEFKLSSVGLRWAEKREKCKKIEDVLALDKEFEEKLQDMKAELFLNGAFEELISNAHSKIASSELSLEQMNIMISGYRRDFIDGKLYPNDNDLSVLSPETTKLAISLKLRIVSLLEGLSLILAKIEKDPSQLKSKDDLFELYVCWLKIVRDKHVLIKSNRKLLSKSVLGLACGNFGAGL
ncbi:hypothetical protein [Vibrio sp. 99-70-13A1]|uniref:hypothetical protein n=1 Tax=Vibrio sp. 99-70-13A1 TaxID=2607601 RepID=UPI001493AD0B|nr:hypothetical protein [Vibrio sp. 99-70-13A1]NOH99487.1 hypothetical protein [Vibrio sp. 99-70-13A1]